MANAFRREAIGAAVSAACLSAVICSTASPAHASIITYSNAAAWAAAVSSPSTVTFNGFTGNDDAGEGQSYAEGGVTFSVGALFEIGGIGPTTNGFEAGTYYGNGYLLWQCDDVACAPNTLTVTLPSASDAIGFDFAELYGDTDTYTIVADGQTFTRATTNGELFFGLTDSNSFTSFTITDLNTGTGNIYPTIDNLSYASSLSSVTKSVPEPSSLTLFGAALIGAASLRRRKPDKV